MHSLSNDNGLILIATDILPIPKIVPIIPIVIYLVVARIRAYFALRLGIKLEF